MEQGPADWTVRLQLLYNLEPDLFPKVGQFLGKPAVELEQTLDGWFSRLATDPHPAACDPTALERADEEIDTLFEGDPVGPLAFYQGHTPASGIALSVRRIRGREFQFWVQVTTDVVHPVLFVRSVDGKPGFFLHRDRLDSRAAEMFLLSPNGDATVGEARSRRPRAGR